MDDVFIGLDDPAMRGVEEVHRRKPQPLSGLSLPARARIISADDHWEICEDIFHERFPAALREKAPRVWFDKYWRIGYRGDVENFPIGKNMEDAVVGTTARGIADWALREEHLSAEGIEKSVVFPHSLLFFTRYHDLEVQEWVYRIYNEYIADLSAKSRGKFYGVGVFSNWWDPAKAETAMQQIVDLGLKTFMAPVNPGNDLNGATILYGDPIMDRFWSVVEQSRIPLNFHIGEGAFAASEHRGGILAQTLINMSPFRKPLGQLIFAGVFDRHPNVEVVFTEGGIGWVPAALQDAEILVDSYGRYSEKLELRPSDYWRRNCYATFQNDLFGLKNLEHIGAGRVLWAADYPHAEGTFGYTRDSLRSVIDATTPQQARLILGDTAARLYRLD